MADIHIKVADVEKVRSELNRAEKEIKAAMDRVLSTLNGADWKDRNRTEFEGSLRTAKASLDAFARAVPDLNSFLSRVISHARSS
jgi:hypothetical protein